MRDVLHPCEDEVARFCSKDEKILEKRAGQIRPPRKAAGRKGEEDRREEVRWVELRTEEIRKAEKREKVETTSSRMTEAASEQAGLEWESSCS